jgi:hypothetical protein
VPVSGRAVVATWGAVSLTDCPLVNLVAPRDDSAAFLAEETGTLTLHAMTPCEECYGHIYMQDDSGLVLSDNSPGARTHARMPCMRRRLPPRRLPAFPHARMPRT